MPKDAHALTQGTCEYFTSHGKRDFADGIQLRTWRWGEDPGLAGQAPCHLKGLYKKEAGGQSKGKEMG